MSVPVVNRTTTIQTAVSRIREYAEIHAAVCRWRKHGVACSTCQEVDERAARAEVRR